LLSSLAKSAERERRSGVPFLFSAKRTGFTNQIQQPTREVKDNDLKIFNAARDTGRMIKIFLKHEDSLNKED
jgi:hypothetical protein